MWITSDDCLSHLFVFQSICTIPFTYSKLCILLIKDGEGDLIGVDGDILQVVSRRETIDLLNRRGGDWKEVKGLPKGRIIVRIDPISKNGSEYKCVT